MDLKELAGLLEQLPEEQLQEIDELVHAETGSEPWVPNPGPQTLAAESEADELFYGGQAGGGKTDLLVGLAQTKHKRSLILRRTNKEAKGLVERMSEMRGSRDGWNGQDGAWRIKDRYIELGGCEHEDDKQKRKGIPHDLKGFDEVSDFSETQYTFIIGWNRSADPNQRCRIIATGNPPTRPEGFWVIRRWAAWLDPEHPNPAQPGELRWYTTDPTTGNEIEVDGRGPHWIGGEEVLAMSRTFIPATLDDNPDLRVTNYRAVLAGLPEREREAYLKGNFFAAVEDDLDQLIPTEWVKAAQERWTPLPPEGTPMTALSADVAQGGKDNTVVVPRYNYYIGKPSIIPGKLTPDGQTVAAEILKSRRNICPIVVDMGGGWGGTTVQHLALNGIEAHAYMGLAPADKRSADRLLGFANLRTQMYWTLREMLDPGQPGGSPVALPPGNVVVADLCSPKYSVKGQASNRTGVVHMESKADLVKRLGRSPDVGDAIIMSLWKGIFHVNILNGDFTAIKRRPMRAVTKRDRRIG